MKRAHCNDLENSEELISDNRPYKFPKHNDEKLCERLPWESPQHLHQILQQFDDQAPELTQQLTKTLGVMTRSVDNRLEGLDFVDDCIRLLRQKCLPLVYPTFEFLALLDLQNLPAPKATTLAELSMDLILLYDLQPDEHLAIASVLQNLKPPANHKLLECVFRVMEKSNCGYDWAENVLLDAPDTPEFLETRGHVLLNAFFNDEGGHECEWLLSLFAKYPSYWTQCLNNPKFHELLADPHRFWSFDLETDDYRDLFSKLWENLPLLYSIATTSHSPFIWLTLQLRYKQPWIQFDDAQALKQMMERSFLELTQKQVGELSTTDYFDFFRVCASMAVQPHSSTMSFPQVHGTPSDLAKLYPFIDMFGDIELEVEGKRLKCHKVMMAQASKYFQLLFTVNMKEKDQPVIQIKDVGADVLEKLIYFVYHHQLEFHSMEEVVQMLFAASRFQIDELKKVCFQSLMDHMDFDSFESIYDVSQYPEFHELKKSLESWLIHKWHGVGDHPLKCNDLKFWEDIAKNYLQEQVASAC